MDFALIAPTLAFLAEEALVHVRLQISSHEFVTFGAVLGLNL
jgi:hypothetical protein